VSRHLLQAVAALLVAALTAPAAIVCVAAAGRHVISVPGIPSSATGRARSAADRPSVTSDHIATLKKEPTMIPVIKLNNRIIAGTILKFGTDCRWTANGVQMKADAQFLVIGIGHALQRWQNGAPIETIIQKPGEDLPDIDELNEAIPRDTWEAGFSPGEKRSPWCTQHMVYLVNLDDAMIYTFASSAIGARIAVETLEGQQAMKSALHGVEVLPLVKLSDALFPTKYGDRRRPEFKVIGWRKLTDGALSAINREGFFGLVEVQPLSMKDELRDENPF
jgi:hypothetical protein